MTSAANLDVQKRTATGTRAARKLRAQNLVPGIVFGHKQEPIPVTVKREDIDHVLKTHDKVVDLQLDGTTETAVITDLQWDTFGINIIHVDFQRVDADERVHVDVNIVLKGLAAGVIEDGGTMEHVHRTLTIECPAIAIPHEIEVRVTDMKLGDELTVGDLPLPNNVKSLEDPSILVAHIIKPTVQELPEEVPGEGGGEPALAGEEEAGEKD